MLCLLAVAGCEELNARRAIQDADALYKEGKFSEAAAMYEKALAKAPDLEVGHHNAGLAYFKLFRSGKAGEKGGEAADRAAEHLLSYLETNPDDSAITDVLHTTWMESGSYDQALAFWTEQHEQFPENLDVLRNLVSVTSQSGDHEAAVKWARKRVDLAEDETAKASAYAKLAGLQLSRLREPDLAGRERLRVADIGIGALQAAEKLQPDRIAVARDLAQLYHQRASAHGASWARSVDLASERIYWQRVNELQKKKKQKQKQKQEAGEAATKDGAGGEGDSADDADESGG